MSALVGLENLVYAKLTDEATKVYASPVKIAPAINAKIKPKINSATLYGDNRAVETVSALGEVEIELEVTDLPLEVQAVLLGHDLDIITGVMTFNANDVAPMLLLDLNQKKQMANIDMYGYLKESLKNLRMNMQQPRIKLNLLHQRLKGHF